MVKKLILVSILIILIIFPPIFPKSLIEGENNNLKSYFGFVFTYFNKDLQRESIFKYKVKGFEKRGVVLKNETLGKSFIFSSDGKLLSMGEINGAITLYFKEEKEPKKYYESIKNFHSHFIYLQDILKDFNLKPYLDLEKDEIYFENEEILIKLGRENYKERIKNVINLLKHEKLTGTIDATFDKIILHKGSKKWKIYLSLNFLQKIK